MQALPDPGCDGRGAPLTCCVTTRGSLRTGPLPLPGRLLTRVKGGPLCRPGCAGWYPECGKAWENWGAPVYTW